MKTGYLVLETHPDHTGMIRARIRAELPNTQDSEEGSTIRYIARFDDVEAALMHLHNELNHKLVDLDSRLYKADIAEAISAIQADELRHQQVWIDPSIDDQLIAKIEAQTTKLKKRHNIQNRIWMMVGGFFVILFFVLNTING
ncbi:MAG: hypothetical protein ABW109_19915 [Candidatus Thiodiazotropha sp. 6PLUC4]